MRSTSMVGASKKESLLKTEGGEMVGKESSG